MRRFLLALIVLVALALSPRAHADPPSPLTRDFESFGPTIFGRDHHWWGRAYFHPAVLADPTTPHPVLVYLHGVNPHFSKYNWMGGGAAPDVRTLVAKLIDQGRIEPSILIAPSTTSSCVLPQALWTGFDLDRFYANAVNAVGDTAAFDWTRVVLIGHSGAGCNTKGGLITALQSTLPLKAVLTIDVCMAPEEAPFFALARPSTDVVVTWQPRWRRPVVSFEERFFEASSAYNPTGLRRVQEAPVTGRGAHTDMVEWSLDEWLPVWLPVVGH